MLNFTDCEIVVEVGNFLFSKRELEDFFSMVAPKPVWKESIFACVPLSDERSRIGMLEAVKYFTGSYPVIEQVDDEMHDVIASGFHANFGEPIPLKEYYEAKRSRN